MPEAATKARTSRLKKILVPLDSSADSLVALQMAGHLAARLQASLEGLFVEDTNLLRAGELSCCRIVHAATASVTSFDRADMERELRLAARSARAALERESIRYDLKWSFRVDRGDVAASILATAPDVDLIVLGRAGHRPGRKSGSGSTARHLTNTAPAVLVTGSRHREGPVACFHADTEAADRALEVAVELARRDGGELVVFSADIDKTREKTGTTAADNGLSVDIRTLPDDSFQTLQSVLQKMPAELVVLPDNLAAVSEAGLDKIPGSLDMPVLIIRARDGK